MIAPKNPPKAKPIVAIVNLFGYTGDCGKEGTSSSSKVRPIGTPVDSWAETRINRSINASTTSRVLYRSVY